jgi:peptidoglycan/LPS O-acetylase OafA/YrhL
VNKKYYRCIDIWKGIAILWVVLGHMGGQYLHARSVHGFSRLLLYNFSSLITPVIDIFLVISGFLVTTKMLENSGTWSYTLFLKKRALRILPMYYALLLFIYYLQKIAFLPGETNLSNFLPYVFFYQNYAGTGVIAIVIHLWFIAFIVQFYVLFGGFYWILSQVMKDSNTIRNCLLLITSALILIIHLLRWKFADSVPHSVWMFPFRGDSILFGCILKLSEDFFYNKHKRDTTFVLPYVLFSIGMIMSIIYVSGYPYDFGRLPFMATINYISIGLMIVGSNYGNAKGNRTLLSTFLEFIGKHSLGIYLFHFPIIAILFFRIKGIGTNFFVLLLTSLIVGIGAEKVSNYLTNSLKPVNATIK